MPSTVVSAITYNHITSTMRVIFVSGTIYDYKRVPLEVFNAMKTSDSKGAYLNKFIKGHYKFEKIK